jgi:DNA (cytosine-5)-methyltransferase 1
MTLRYLSLFTGIGGFEVAIHRVFPEAECVGYSEVKPTAIKVYQHHFPSHTNLGDIAKISDYRLRQIRRAGCDLVVGGFPCTNLTSMARFKDGDSRGLKGAESSLFYQLIRVLRVVRPRHVVVENNASMTTRNRDLITQALNRVIPTGVSCTLLDAASFGVQTRRRLFWTTFPVTPPDCHAMQRWSDVLLPVSEIGPYLLSDNWVNMLNRAVDEKPRENGHVAVKVAAGGWEFRNQPGHHSRWQKGWLSDTMTSQEYKPYPVGKCRTVIGCTGGTTNVLVDRRCDVGFHIRHLAPLECERLFYFPDDYTLIAKYKTPRTNLLGNSVVVRVVEHLLHDLACFSTEVTRTGV